MTKDKENDKDFCDLLRQYPRAIVHLRSQVRKQRFGTILGAGISIDFGAPQWGKPGWPPQTPPLVATQTPPGQDDGIVVFSF